jgi:hypothetical protein
MAENTISPQLLDRINQFAGDGSISDQEMNMMQTTQAMNMLGQTKGAIPDREMQLFKEASPSFQTPKAEIGVAIEALSNQIRKTDDPDEKAILNKVVEKFELNEKAPLADIAQSVQQAGTGEDTVLAHLSPGEVVLPAQFMEDEQLESMIEAKFTEAGIDPSKAVAGIGIASLNQMTGLEEFGFFKKLGKSLKKFGKTVVRPVANVLQFVPGPLQPIAALASKAMTVYDVAKGRANPLALLSVAGPLKVGQGIGESITAIKDAGSGSFLSGLGKSFSKGLGSLRSDIGSLIQNPTQTLANLARSATGVQSLPQTTTIGGTSFNEPFVGTDFSVEAAANKMFPDKPLFDNPFSGVDTGIDVNKLPGLDPKFMAALADANKQQDKSLLEKALEFVTPGEDDKGLVSNLADSVVDEEGGLSSLAKLGLAGTAAAKLGQLAMEEARKDKGVPLTPLTTMDAVGRYNIEAEIARRMGLPAPNPVEFGLQPRFPTLSGAQAGPRREAVISPYLKQAAMGGAIMPMMYAEGGAVAMQEGGEMNPNEFPRMDGDINGPGTETSDDIPAMLSDGEFVMTGRAVRGAGSFELNEEPNGILTLVPSASESREKGTQLMYKMMDVFGRYADATS